MTTRAHRPPLRWVWWAGLLVVMAGCRATWRPLPTATPLPTPRPQIILSAPTAPKVVMVAVPGMTPAAVNSLLARRPDPVPTIRHLADRGRTASVVPVQPPLAAPSMASLATGALPADHKAVSNALDVSVLARPSLWQRATQAGLRAAVINWPHANEPPLPPIWVIPRGRFADAAQHTVVLSPPSGPWANAPPSFAPPLEGHLPLRLNERDVGEIWMLALDTQDDGRTEYDTFLLDTDRNVGPESAFLTSQRPWASLQVAPDAGVELKFQGVEGETLTIFQSNAMRFSGLPPGTGAGPVGHAGLLPARCRPTGVRARVDWRRGHAPHGCQTNHVAGQRLRAGRPHVRA
ncbi:MAG: alkaline phosphatase family protein [Ardenticatenia bacterium]|nr:alkaline phosphatase family protein [Ardenticatenia bacterium]